MNRYIIYQPSKKHLHLVEYLGDLPEGDTYVILLHRPYGVSDADVEVIESALQALEYHYLGMELSDV